MGREAAAPVALEKEEGGVFFDGGALALAAADDAGLQAAAEAYSARAPYQWRVPGEKLAAIADAVRAAAPGMPVELVGVTYQKGKAGVHRAFLRSSGTIAAAALEKALASPHLAAVHSLAILGGATAVSAKAEPAVPPQASGAGAGAPAAEGAAGAAAGAPTRLDLATLYTSRGLFGAAGRIPAAGLARTATSTCPRAPPASPWPTWRRAWAWKPPASICRWPLPSTAPPRATSAPRRCWPAIRRSRRRPNRNCARRTPPRRNRKRRSRAGEGELRIVDDAFGRRAAVLARGDEAGSAAALGLLADRFPNLWEQGKQHLSLEEIRYDLHRFFSLARVSGRPPPALYHLDRWMKEHRRGRQGREGRSLRRCRRSAVSPISSRSQLQEHDAAVKTGSLHAGTQCCDQDPACTIARPTCRSIRPRPTFSRRHRDSVGRQAPHRCGAARARPKSRPART